MLFDVPLLFPRRSTKFLRLLSTVRSGSTNFSNNANGNVIFEYSFFFSFLFFVFSARGTVIFNRDKLNRLSVFFFVATMTPKNNEATSVFKNEKRAILRAIVNLNVLAHRSTYRGSRCFARLTTHRGIFYEIQFMVINRERLNEDLIVHPHRYV